VTAPVSVVIPTHNRCEMLKDTLASVLRQSFRDFEVLVVDDASQDSTWSWLGGVDDARVRKLRIERHGERVTARNTGLQTVTTPWVLFLDDDDLLPRHALETHVRALERSPEALISVGSYAMFGEGRPVPAPIRIVRRRSVRRVWGDVVLGWTAVPGQCMFRVDALRSLNGWNGRWIPIEDQALWLEASRLGPFVLLPDIVLFYRVHAGQWRPDDYKRMQTQVREESVERRSDVEREQGLRLLRWRALTLEAFDRYQDGRRASALALYLRVLASAPQMWTSPLSRGRMLTSILKCLLGARGAHGLVKVEESLRRMLAGARYELEEAV
jgi:glycosyltransferase involved in cell wall biosynthesis